MPLTGIHDAFQLQAAQASVLHLVVQVQLIGDVWWLDCGKTGCLHHGVWVLLPV